MCTAAEAKTLQRVYGRYNSFFRKVIPIKRVQKPVRWYTRLTVYGNPGRVVNGCAPGIPVLICGFGVVVCGGGCSGVLRRVDARPRSYRGTRPRFASGTLMLLPEGIATPRTRLDSREVHPVLARQLCVRLHKALRSRTRGTIDAHALIAHRLKQTQQLRGHAVCRQQRPLRVTQLRQRQMQRTLMLHRLLTLGHPDVASGRYSCAARSHGRAETFLPRALGKVS